VLQSVKPYLRDFPPQWERELRDDAKRRQVCVCLCAKAADAVLGSYKQGCQESKESRAFKCEEMKLLGSKLLLPAAACPCGPRALEHQTCATCLLSLALF
jgi:hypothetical protein